MFSGFDSHTLHMTTLTISIIWQICLSSINNIIPSTLVLRIASIILFIVCLLGLISIIFILLNSNGICKFSQLDKTLGSYSSLFPLTTIAQLLMAAIFLFLIGSFIAQLNLTILADSVVRILLLAKVLLQFAYFIITVVSWLLILTAPLLVTILSFTILILAPLLFKVRQIMTTPSLKTRSSSLREALGQILSLFDCVFYLHRAEVRSRWGETLIS